MPKLAKALRRDKERDRRYNFRSDNRKSVQLHDELLLKRSREAARRLKEMGDAS